MSDKKEEILVFLEEFLDEIPDVSNVCYRNHPGLDGMQRPSFLLLDGSEMVVGTLQRQQSSRGDSLPPPVIVDLEPEIFHAMRTLPAARSAEVGPAMSAIRFATIGALWKSAELARLLGPNGGVIYRGHTTDLRTGMRALGVQQFMFSFRYVLDPSDFV